MKCGILFTAAILAGCTPLPTPSPGQIESDLNREYDGQPAKQFFYDYGSSAGERELDDGGYAYRWVSIEPYDGPARENGVMTFRGNGSYAIVDTYNGVPEAQYCELRIYADKADNIRRIAVAVDSMGKHSASRCSEVL